MSNIIPARRIPISTKGLLAYYPFVGNYKDRSGNGNDMEGTYGDPSIGHGIADMDGSDSFKLPSLIGSSPSAFSWFFSFNIHFIQRPNTGDDILMPGADIYYQISIGNAESSHHTMDRSLALRSDQGGSWHDLFEYQLSTLNQWYTVCTTYDDTTGHQMFLDGGNKKTDGETGTFDASGSEGCYGSWDSGYRPIDGELGALYCFNRVLSQAEISRLHRAEKWRKS